MKRLADYKDEAAFDLLAELLEPFAKIFANEELKAIWSTKPKIEVAKFLFSNQKSECIQLIKAIDPEIEITPFSILKCVLDLVIDVQNDPVIKDFFTYAEQTTDVSGGSGSAMESTEGGAE